MMKFILGSELHPADRQHVLSRFVHRFTADHRPTWARQPMPDGSPYPVQFASDDDWLAHTAELRHGSEPLPPATG